MSYNPNDVLLGTYDLVGELIEFEKGVTYYKQIDDEYVAATTSTPESGVDYYIYNTTGPQLYAPGESTWNTDFIGFSFNGIHCSELGFWRTSDGQRYNDVVIPNFSDTVAQMPGHDGTLYWESFYSNRTFSVPIAFDEMTEVQYRRFRQVFNGKVYADLIFDEAPYKRYHVKVQSPPQLQTICFMENGERVYKGEGTIVFVAYFPFARQVHKYLNEYDIVDYPNKNEWKVASQMRTSSAVDEGNWVSGNIDAAPTWNIRVYNAGDVETDIKAYYSPYEPHWCTSSTQASALGQLYVPNNNGAYVSSAASTVASDYPRTYYTKVANWIAPTRIELGHGARSVQSDYEGEDEVIAVLTIDSALGSNLKGNDVVLRFNSATNLVEGCDANYKPTGTLYNEYLKSGDFFKLPATPGVVLNKWWDACFRFRTYNKPNGAKDSLFHMNCVKVEYDYLYY